MDVLISFVLAGIALAGSPGPNTLSLAATGAAFGARRGLAYLGGLVIGMVLVMLITATGVIGLVLAIPGATPVITLAAAAYFLYLAWRIATAPPLAHDSGQGQEPSVAAGILLSLANPKAYAAMAALFSGFVLVNDRLVLDAALKLLVLVAVITAVCLVWLNAGAWLTRLFRDPRASRAINIIFAVLLIASLGFTLLL